MATPTHTVVKLASLLFLSLFLSSCGGGSQDNNVGNPQITSVATATTETASAETTNGDAATTEPASSETTKSDAATTNPNTGAPYPIVDGLYQRPEGTPVTAIDGKYEAPCPKCLGGKYLMFYRGDSITLSGQGYFLMRWETAYFNRVGELVMPTFTNLSGTLLHVANADGRNDDLLNLDPSKEAGETLLGRPSVGYQTLPPGTPMIWNNQYFYLDGTVTINQNERGADYNLGITPVSWSQMHADVTRPVLSSTKIVRPGVSYDPYNGATTPAAPTELTASAVASNIELSWTDNANNEDGYQIEYSDGALAADGVTKLYRLAGTLPANSTQQTIGFLAPNKTYYFRIRSYNASGNSTYSNITQATTAASQPLTAPWKVQDIGIDPSAASTDESYGVAGTAYLNNGVFQIAGSGRDIWNGADHFRYVYQPMVGDGTLSARVTSFQYTSGWAKIGVMIRETLDPGSSYQMVEVTPGNGVVAQHRTNTGSVSAQKKLTGLPVIAPYWLKVTRQGNTFTTYCSTDGKNWTTVNTRTIPMASQVYVGLAVTSNNTAMLNTASIDKVVITQP